MNTQQLHLPLAARDPVSRAPLAASADPHTSHEAASRLVGTGQLDTELERIAAGLAIHPGLTSRELAAAIGEDRYMVAKRMSVLAARGVAKRGEARTCTGSGRLAVTWWPLAGGVQ